MVDCIGSGKREIPAVMTIAGSDSGAGAGVQADLKTFAALDVLGTCAITCVTAQNPSEVSGIEAVSADMVALQIQAVCRGFPISAAKTGMLYSSEIIRAVSSTVAECSIAVLVVDPVMVATSGARLLQEDAIDALCSALVPRATVVTPNVPEGEILCGDGIGSVEDLKSAAAEIGRRFDTACVLKGGHLCSESAEVVNALCADGEVSLFRIARADVTETHGTGCVFSAALTAYLAGGASLPDATQRAGDYVAAALDSVASGKS